MVGRRAWLAAGLVVVLVAALTSVIFWRAHGTSDGPLGPDIAAVVDGHVIRRDRVELAVEMGAATSRAEALNAFIDEELLFAYGEKRGLAPSDEAVRKALSELREQTPPDALEQALAMMAERGQVMDADAYWGWPAVASSLRKSITVGQARAALANERVPGTYDEAIAAGLARLRREATIRINPDALNPPTPP